MFQTPRINEINNMALSASQFDTYEEYRESVLRSMEWSQKLQNELGVVIEDSKTKELFPFKVINKQNGVQKKKSLFSRIKYIIELIRNPEPAPKEELPDYTLMETD